MKIALFGATGRLGRAIASLASAQVDLGIAEAIAHPASPSLGEEILPKVSVSAIFSHLSEIAIDVSLPQESPASLAANIPLVIGTTALSFHAMEKIRQTAKRVPIFYTPNFSIGMALFTRFCLDAAKELPACTLDLFEAHHRTKKDTPSGSALRLSRELEQAGKAVAIHSMRSGKIVGEHRLILNTDEERLEIAHTAHSRAAYAKGALEAARFLRTKQPGLYGMDDLLLYLRQ